MHRCGGGSRLSLLSALGAFGVAQGWGDPPGAIFEARRLETTRPIDTTISDRNKVKVTPVIAHERQGRGWRQDHGASGGWYVSSDESLSG